MDKILSSLTEAQQAAVRHVDGPLLILAGPGSGKTRVVTHRVAYMREQGITDEQLVALTFTNKAADEMRLRLERLAPGSRVWMGTFHRFCARLLRQYASLVGLHENFSIYDPDDSLKLLREAIEDEQVELVHATPARVAAAISWAKNDLIGPDQYRPSLGSPLGYIVSNVYPRYQQRLLEANAVDFDDLLMHVAILLRDHDELRQTLDARFQYILVDEYQDTNLAQYAIVRALSVDYPNLAVTGDPDQSIYGWRGATIRNILEFEHDFPAVKVVRLEQNWRSTKSILRVADHLIAHNAQRKEKTLFTDNPEGRPVRVVVYASGQVESQAIASRIANEVAAGLRRPSDYAVFYRTNALSRSLERALAAVSVPYQIVRGLEFYQRKEVKDILGYLQLLENPASDVAFLRVINTPPRGIGQKTISHLKRYAADRHLCLLDAAREAGLIEPLAKRAAVEVARFMALYDTMRLTGDEKVADLIARVLQQTGYREWLASSESAEDQQRVENVDELLTDAREFDETHLEDGGLETFLEQASLVADVDAWDACTDRVSMMTLHAAKGLEFPVVFVVAVEEDLLPHVRSKDDVHQEEEERRLLFVGMTRAKEELHLSAANLRAARGSSRVASPSRFLLELPAADMEIVGRLAPHAPGVQDWPDSGDWDPAYADQVADDDAQDDHYDDDCHDHAPARRRKGKKENRKRPRSVATGSALVTAAELAGHPAANTPCPPDTFRHGMVVTHPEYGLGKIVALSGSDAKRSATVQFAHEQRTRTFQLAYGAIRPVKTNHDT